MRKPPELPSNHSGRLLLPVLGCFTLVSLAVVSGPVLIGIVAACILVSGFFAGAEQGFYRMSLLRVKCRAKAGQPAAKRLDRLSREPRSFVSMTLIATNVSVYVASLFVTRYLTELVGADKAELTATCTLSIVLLIFAEIIPKTVFQLRSQRLMERASAFLTIAKTVFKPGIAVLRWVSRLPEVLGLPPAAEASLFTPRRVNFVLTDKSARTSMSLYQKTIARNILGLKNIPVSRVMIPLKRVVAIPAELELAGINERLKGQRFSRYPVYSGRPANMIGLLHILDVAGASGTSGETASKLARKALKLEGGASVAEALFSLQKEQQALGIVTGASGNAIGIVTVKDLVEEVVGELAAW